MNNRTSTILIVVIVALVGVVGYLVLQQNKLEAMIETERKDSESALTRQKQQSAAELATAVEEAKRPKYQHQSEALSSGLVMLPAGSTKAFEVSVDTSIMQNSELSGRFEAKGGVGDDIQVLVFDHDNYINWNSGHASQSIFDSGLKTVGNVSTTFPKSGKYYVVVSNKQASFWARTVDTNLKLDYDKRVF